MADGTEGGGDWFDILFGGGGGEEVGPPAYLKNDSGDVGPPAYLAGGGERDAADAYAALYGDTAASPQGGATFGAGVTGGGPAGGGSEGGIFDNFVNSAGSTISGWWKDAGDIASKIFTNQPSTTTRVNPETGKLETVEKPGGGLSSLGQLLIAGALQGVSSGMASKSKQEAESKEKKKERTFEREKIAEGYARKEYGTAPQIGQATRGTGLLYNKG